MFAINLNGRFKKKMFPGMREAQTNAHDFMAWAEAFLKCP